MTNPFHRTLRSLRAERSLALPLSLLSVSVLLIAWLIWFLRSELPVYAASQSARLESQQAAYPVSAQVTGRVRRVVAAAGQEVKAGELLIELEATVEARRIEEEGATLAALSHQLDRLRAETKQRVAGLEAGRRVALLKGREADERVRGAAAALALAEEDLARKERLHGLGLLPLSDLAAARAHAERQRAEASEAEVALRRLQEEQNRDENDRAAALHEIEREMAEVRGALGSRRAILLRLEEEEAWRSIRAPVSGQLADLAPIGAGTLVQPGERLGAVVPRDRLRIAANFEPAEAIGRLRPGQPAQMRLDGFPWTRYGALSARVSRVSSELRDGRVRVELVLEGRQLARVPVQHGLPGLVLVETERLSPFALLMRTLGKAAPPPEPSRGGAG